MTNRTAPTVTRFEVTPTALLLTLESGEQVTLEPDAHPDLCLIPQGGGSVLLTAWQDNSVAYTVPSALVGGMTTLMNLETSRKLGQRRAARKA